MKVHWWTYNHRLFVSYLTSVAFGYGWISDNKFKKFSDMDWIFKNFSDMDQESKNQYPLTSAYWIVIISGAHPWLPPVALQGYVPPGRDEDGSELKSILAGQYWIGLQFFSKLADQDWTEKMFVVFM